MNMRFREPPWTPLGSPSSLARLDLSPDILGGRVFCSFQGDVPDWFYRLRWPSSLAEYFVLEKVSPLELFMYARDRGITSPRPAEDDIGVGAMAPIMG